MKKLNNTGPKTELWVTHALLTAMKCSSNALASALLA